MKFDVINISFFAWILLPVSLHAEVDTNGNGMSDIWEHLYCAVGLEPSSDEDGDGHSNLTECRNGTDPMDPSSMLNFEYYHPVEGALRINWSSEQGVSYLLEASETLEVGSWRLDGLPVISGGASTFVLKAVSPLIDTHFRVRVSHSDGQHLAEASEAFRSVDSDGDGSNDLAEWLAGTDQYDRSDKLRITDISAADGLIVSWRGLKGKNYRLQKNCEGTWVTIEGIYQGSGDLMEVSLVVDGDTELESLRIVSEDTDTDGDGVTDWEELVSGFNANQPDTKGKSRGDLQEITDLLSSEITLSVDSLAPVANLTTMEFGAVRIKRTGGLNAVDVTYFVSGTALEGIDFERIANGYGNGSGRNGVIRIPFGVDSVAIPVVPKENSHIVSSESVVLRLLDSENYNLGKQVSQSVNILREVSLSVKDFGAVGNGVVDDSLAVQAAINNLESSTIYNTLHFPAGVYRLATKIWNNTGTSPYRILHLGQGELEGRDIIFRAGGDATLFSDISPQRSKILLANGKFRSLAFKGLTWEKTSRPLARVTGEPNGSDGVLLAEYDGRTVEAVTFDDCRFINCHRSVTVNLGAFANVGRLKLIRFTGCRFSNPYGTNTIDGTAAYGGGLQNYISSWAAHAVYKGNVFDGGGDTASDETTNPGGKIKDGSYFGSPLRLDFTNNVVRNMRVESVAQVNDHTRLGPTKNTFLLPAFGQSTLVNMNFSTAGLIQGQILNLRFQGRNNSLRIDSNSEENDSLLLTNIGHIETLSAGTSITWNTPAFLQTDEPTYANVSDNFFDLNAPEFGPVENPSGVTVNAHGIIERNIIIGARVGINIYVESRTPVFPSANGMLIKDNLIRLPDTSSGVIPIAYGIFTWADYPIIKGNRVSFPSSRRVGGIAVAGRNSQILENLAVAEKATIHGYTSFYRGVGVTFVNGNSVDSYLDKNYTSGFDVGVGPAVPYLAVPYTVNSHVSKGDQIGVDSSGLIQN